MLMNGEHNGTHDQYKCGNCNMVMNVHDNTIYLRCGWCGSKDVTYIGHR